MVSEGTLANQRLPVLKGSENWKTWSALIKKQAIGDDLWSYIDPNSATRKDPSTTAADGEKKKVDAAATAAWLVKTNKAGLLLVSNCSGDIQESLVHLETAWEIYDTLKKEYGASGIAHRMQVYEKWAGTTLETDLEAFCRQYRETVGALKVEDLELPPEIVIYGFISRVTASYPTWASITRNSLQGLTKDKLPTLDSLIEKITTEDKADGDGASANLARKRALAAREKGKGTKFCKWCEPTERDHTTHDGDNCWTKYPHKMPKNIKKARETAAKAKGEEDSDSTSSKRKPELIFMASSIPSTKAAHAVSQDVFNAAVAHARKDDWIFDTGASITCVNDLRHFTSHKRCYENVYVGDDEALKAEAVGTVRLELLAPSGEYNTVSITECLYVPRMAANLLSGEMLRRKGLFYRNDTQVLFTHKSDIGTVKNVRGLPVLVLKGKEAALIAYAAEEEVIEHIAMLSRDKGTGSGTRVKHVKKGTAAEWHQRFGHASGPVLAAAVKTHLGIDITGKIDLPHCEACAKATLKKVHSRVPTERPESCYDELNVDTVVPTTPGLGGARYFTLATDSTCLYRHAHVSRNLAGLHGWLIDLIQYVKTQLGKQVKRIRLDNHKAILNKKFKEWCAKEGIKLLPSTPHNSEQNGRAEVSNHLVTVLARKLMFGGNVPLFLWPEAVTTAVYLLNRLPSQALDHECPYAVLVRNLKLDNTAPQPSLSHLRPFGCKTQVYDNDVRRGDKFHSRALSGILVGYEGVTIYRVWVPSLQRVVRSVSCTFGDESVTAAEDDDDVPLFAAHHLAPDPEAVDTNKYSALGGEDDEDKAASASADSEEEEAPTTPRQQGLNEKQQLQFDDADYYLSSLGPQIGSQHRHVPGELRTPPTSRSQRQDQDSSPLSSPPTTLSPPATPFTPSIRASPQQPPPPVKAIAAPPAHSKRQPKPSELKQQVNDNAAVGYESKAYTGPQVPFEFSMVDQHPQRLESQSLPRAVHTAMVASIHAQPTAKPHDAYSEEIVIPRTAAEARASPQAEFWVAAMDSEHSNLTRNVTWKTVALALLRKGINIIKGKWVFTIKRDADGQIVRYKARWVARGFTQQYGIDYEDTYAAVTKPDTVRMLLSLIATKKLPAKQYDIITAFLEAMGLGHEIYVEQPHGYEERDENGVVIEGLVCFLLRALYGLKQSPLLWYNELTKFLAAVHFTPLWSDSCLFTNKAGAVIMVYVDDLIITARTQHEIDGIAASLKDRFQVKELGDLHYYLGCRIVRDFEGRRIYMLQDGYMKKVADKFHRYLQASRRHDTPINANFHFEKAPEGFVASNHAVKLYQSLVGSVVWPAQMTRLDCLFAVTQLSKYLTNPMPEHIEQGLRTIAYLISTASFGIVLGCDELPKLIAYVDASFADDIDTRRSTCGFTFYYGGPIHFKSGRQSIVAQSTTEAEYVAMTLAAKEAAYLRNKLTELELEPEVITLYEDNQPAMDLLKRTAADGKSKHMDLRWHYIRQEVDAGRIEVVKVDTTKQLADGLTKPLDSVKFVQWREAAGVIDCSRFVAEFSKD